MATTNRDKFAALQQEMAVEQEEAMLGLHDWFQSDDGKAFAQKLIDTHQKTIPGGHYDQILSAFLSTAGNVETLATKVSTTVAERKAAEEAAQTPDPTAPTVE